MYLWSDLVIPAEAILQWNLVPTIDLTHFHNTNILAFPPDIARNHSLHPPAMCHTHDIFAFLFSFFCAWILQCHSYCQLLPTWVICVPLYIGSSVCVPLFLGRLQRHINFDYLNVHLPIHHLPFWSLTRTMTVLGLTLVESSVVQLSSFRIDLQRST